jgi:hypothetical protein
MAWKAPPPEPQSLQEHITSSIGKVPNLSPKQRASVVAAMVTLCRDISFLKLAHDQVGWAPRSPSDEGRVL